MKNPPVKGKKRLEIGVACIIRDKKILIQTRPKGKSFVGKWEFPGGKIEPGETSQECVIREIKEELGVEITAEEKFFQDKHYFKNTILVLNFHKCQIISGEPAPQENQKIEWVSLAETKNFKFLPTNYNIAKKLRELPELN